MKKIILVILFLLQYGITNAQLLAEEAVFFYYLHGTLPANNGKIDGGDYNLYLTSFHQEEYFKAQKNEFEYKDFLKKMGNHISNTLNTLNKETIFMHTTPYTLKGYNFDTQSFSDFRPYFPAVFNYVVFGGGGGKRSFSCNVTNYDKFNFTLPMASDRARAFLAANPSRKIYLVGQYSFDFTDSGNPKVFNVRIRKVDMYGDKYLNNLLKTFYPSK